MLSFTYRQASTDGYRIKFDGVEIGSVAKRISHMGGREYWRWVVDAVPLMEQGRKMKIRAR
jgi:hypothetical protein